MASKAETVRSIRAEWLEETGEDPGQVGAEVLLDRMCDAFVHMVEGVGVAHAVHRDRRVAEYLKWQWTGEDGRKIRDALALDAAGLAAAMRQEAE